MKDLLVDDEVTRALLPRFEEAARILREAVSSGRQVLVRFDNDADGISAALSLVEAIEGLASGLGRKPNIRALRNESAIYREEDALLDLTNAANLGQKPVLVLMDHGANEQSLPAVAEARKAGFQVIAIDHHPTTPKDVEKAVNVFVSPWAVSNKGSDYTTALLSYEVARRVWPQQAQKEDYAWWGLQGDKSVFAQKREFKEQKVLDYLACYSEDTACLPSYRKAIANKAEVERLYRAATEKASETLERAMSYTKVKNLARISLAIAKTGFQRGRWPPKGGLVNIIHERLWKELNRPLVTIGYGDDRIILRANPAAFEAGFRSNELICHLKDEMPHAIESGGGHEVAAAIKVKPEHMKAVLARLTELIEKRFS